MKNKIKLEYNEDGSLFQGIKETKFSKNWYVDGLLHRVVGPAEINYDGNGKVESLRWYKHGVLHRFKNPAIIARSGFKAWYKEGNLVKINDNGHLEYYNLLGQIHRLDGPAIIKKNGDKEWYMYGKLHRTNEPAVELTNGYKAWFTNGILDEESGNNYTKCSYDEKIDINKLSEIFYSDLYTLISKYDSDPRYKLLASFLKHTKVMFEDLIRGRDELLTYKKEVTLVDCPSIFNDACCIEEERKI